MSDSTTWRSPCKLCMPPWPTTKIRFQHKITDLEACSRRQNIKVVDLPERAEGNNPVDFLANFLRDLLGPAIFPNPIGVVRVHRLGQPPDAGGRPHVLIARIHSFRVKEKILRRTPLLHSTGYRSSSSPTFRQRL